MNQVVRDVLVQIDNQVTQILVGIKALGLNVRAVLRQNPVDVLQDALHVLVDVGGAGVSAIERYIYLQKTPV